jgi:hypothetical protein
VWLHSLLSSASLGEPENASLAVLKHSFSRFSLGSPSETKREVSASVERSTSHLLSLHPQQDFQENFAIQR